ncbi:Pentatricopeptide repeat-containing protein [Camellia lanceoleosa]|uniref:Pentatricopeptide repeat-containing protein n=1 Tax=Camellia lanceoleosa TaxID=1840588 RepID=A0ACC0FKP0_9ERIC|nr:Pentatricopeptide repeat-containing protein [Camellia lanceoleosa]
MKEESLCSDVNDACINLGWLETAHDILDVMKLGGTPMGTRSYISLLRAYHERKMFGEAEALLKQNKKAGLVEKMFDEAITVSDGVSDLAKSIIRELEEEGKTLLFVVYENQFFYLLFLES